MKNLITLLKKSVLLLTLIVSIYSCVDTTVDDPPVSTLPYNPDLVVTIADLKLKYDTQGEYTIEGDSSLFALVVGDDVSGNLYKSAIFQDATGGITGFNNGAGLFAGDSVRIYLKGVTVSQYHGLMQLQNFTVDKNIVKQKVGVPLVPKTISIDEAVANLDAYQSTLVKIEGVQFVDEELGMTYADTVGLTTQNRHLEDCNGNQIIVRTSGYAGFAGMLLPEGNGDITAVLGRYDNTAQLLLSNTDYVFLNGERCGNGGGTVIDPVESVDESFDGATAYEDININGWQNIAVAGTRKWQGKDYNGNKYAQASGYNSGLDYMETWLITAPVVNTNGDKILSFKTAKAYWSHTTLSPMTVMVSTDYDGTNFETATWTTINPVIADASSADNDWIESGDFALSDYVGNVTIAFKYEGSDTESTSYRLDDIKISTEGGGGGGGGGAIDPVESVNQSFDDATNYEDINFEGWTNIAVAGSRKWQGKEYSGNLYAQASAYNSGLDYMETWLITPPVINTDGTKSLSFKTAKAYWSSTTLSPMTVMVSTDYDGTNFETATWTTINPVIADESTPDHQWVESGDFPLSDYTGNVSVAFKYEGSDTESTSYRVDDIVIATGY